MKNEYITEQKLTAAFTDRRCEMDVYHASQLFQDAFTEFFTQYGCDSVAMGKTHGAVWAIARSKFVYDRLPLWGEWVRMKAFPVKISAASVHLNVLVETLEGEPLLRCRQEMCVVNVTDHSLRRVNTTPFPMDLPLQPPVLDTPFERRKLALDGGDLAYTHIVLSTDTDLNGHLNNVAYVRLLLDAFPSDFWDAHPVQAFDIHFAAESREGEELQIFRKQEGDEIAFQIRAGDRAVIKAFLSLRPQGETE